VRRRALHAYPDHASKSALLLAALRGVCRCKHLLFCCTQCNNGCSSGCCCTPLHLLRSCHSTKNPAPCMHRGCLSAVNSRVTYHCGYTGQVGLHSVVHDSPPPPAADSAVAVPPPRLQVPAPPPPPTHTTDTRVTPFGTTKVPLVVNTCWPAAHDGVHRNQ